MGVTLNAERKGATEYTKNYNHALRENFNKKYIEEEVPNITSKANHLF